MLSEVEARARAVVPDKSSRIFRDDKFPLCLSAQTGDTHARLPALSKADAGLRRAS